MRDEIIDTLTQLAYSNEKMVFLEADCGRSTGSNRLAMLFPDRYIQVGIAEQNMLGIASGLARSGLIPIVFGFAAILISRALEQIIHQICQPSLHVVIIGGYSGYSAAEEGAPHHAVFDIGLLYGIPSMEIYTPSTRNNVRCALVNAIKQRSPSYIRVSKQPAIALGDLISENEHSEMEHFSWYGGPVSENIILSAGPELGRAVSAWLTDKRIEEFSFVSPVRLKYCTQSSMFRQVLGQAKRVVSIEEHCVTTGLGSIMSQIFDSHSTKPIFKKIGIHDQFTESGSYEWVAERFGTSIDVLRREVFDGR